jgi:hypothetical protein
VEVDISELQRADDEGAQKAKSAEREHPALSTQCPSAIPHLPEEVGSEATGAR